MAGSKGFETTRQTIETAVQNVLQGEEFRGIKTGYSDLDSKITGLGAGELIIIGGRPSMGKTAFALNLVDKIAVTDNKSCLYFSLEDSAQRLVERLIREISGVELPKHLSDTEKKKIMSASETLQKTRLIIDDKAVSIEQIEETARNCAVESTLDFIVVDYLQLVSNQDSNCLQSTISCVVRKLKTLAKELDLPVVVLSQLNRTVEKLPDHRPRLIDLKGSSDIEDIADKVLLLYRDEYYYYESERRGIMEVNVAKNITGYRTCIELAYMASNGKIYNIER